MRILVVSGRYPMAGGKGDQSRAWSFISHLAARHTITVVTASSAHGEPNRAALESIATVHEVEAGVMVRLFSAATAVVSLRPGQCGWMLPPRAAALARAQAPSHDVVLVNTVRSYPWGLSGAVVLDHVDALSLNMRERAVGCDPTATRLAAALEGRLLARTERRAARRIAAQIVTTSRDAAFLPPDPPPTVIPVAWDGPNSTCGSGEDEARDIDVIFTGNMSYPPNREAARLIDTRIVPLIRRSLPDASVWIVGRGADRLGLHNVEVAADVPDVREWLRRSRVALVPLRRGTGSPYKVLEAAASGAALVTCAWAAAAFEMNAVTADSDEEFAARAVELLKDADLRDAWRARERPAVERNAGAVLAARLETVLESAATKSRAAA